MRFNLTRASVPGVPSPIVIPSRDISARGRRIEIGIVTRYSRKVSHIHSAPNLHRQFPNRDVQPICLLLGRIQQRPGKLLSKHIYPQSSLHFPGPLMSNVELPADMTVASCRVVIQRHPLSSPLSWSHVRLQYNKDCLENFPRAGACVRTWRCFKL